MQVRVGMMEENYKLDREAESDVLLPCFDKNNDLQTFKFHRELDEQKQSYLVGFAIFYSIVSTMGRNKDGIGM